jgi:hypothetical protein
VPKWIDSKTQEIDEEKVLIQDYGTGKRKRNEVNYTEVLSETRWLQIVEKGEDPEKEIQRVIKRRKLG